MLESHAIFWVTFLIWLSPDSLLRRHVCADSGVLMPSCSVTSYVDVSRGVTVEGATQKSHTPVNITGVSECYEEGCFFRCSGFVFFESENFVRSTNRDNLPSAFSLGFGMR